MIVAISSVKNEAEIIAKTVSHLYGEGVDEVVVSVGPSSDLTFNQAVRAGALVQEQLGPFDQSAEMTRLATMVGDDATWIVPFDADEFWTGTDGRTIADILNELPPTTTRVYAPVYTHLDLATRAVTPKTWGKVAFRPHPDMHLGWGNHHVLNGDGDDIHGILAIRELQYRDYPHFLAKVTKARELFDSWAVPPEHGSHMRGLVLMDPEHLAEAYASHCNIDTIHDPIPYKGTIPWT